MTHKQRADLTFKDNLKRGRHGWVRLTPAYSVKIVQQILDDHPEIKTILEPFSGTGTTGLVASQHGLHCDLLDINPFLLWLAQVKCADYTSTQIEQARGLAQSIIKQAQADESNTLWTPPISNIHRWWAEDRLHVLARVFTALNALLLDASPVRDLLLIAFCRLVIRWSNAAFNHQSMSFKQEQRQQRLFDEDEEILHSFVNDVEVILGAAAKPLQGTVETHHQDARYLSAEIGGDYDAVITSPPYVNRMSYIRELRPYMFWLGYLHKARDAGELDWQAIGGTWGIATSRLKDWKPAGDLMIPGLTSLVSEIRRSSDVLGNYVHRYFVDMHKHFAGLYDVVAPGGRLFYIIGNSKFYDTLVPAEQIYANLMQKHGFIEIDIQTIRKRNSKKELYEYLVTARKSS